MEILLNKIFFSNFSRLSTATAATCRLRPVESRFEHVLKHVQLEFRRRYSPPADVRRTGPAHLYARYQAGESRCDPASHVR